MRRRSPKEPWRQIAAPNYTQAPNVYYDEWLPEIKGEAELKVINVVIRETFGWHREKAQLSITDIQEKAGLASRSSATAGAKRAVEHGYLVRVKEGNAWLYSLSVASPESVPAASPESVLPAEVDSPEAVLAGGSEAVLSGSPESVPPIKDKEKGSKKELNKEDSAKAGAAAPSDQTADSKELATEAADKLGLGTAAAAAKDPDDFVVWTMAVRALTAAKYPERQARSFLGKAIKDHGKAHVTWCVCQMLAQTPLIAPLEYLAAILVDEDKRKERDRARSNVGASPAESWEVGKSASGPFELTCNAVALAMSSEGLTLNQAIERLRDPNQRGYALDGINDGMVRNVINYFVHFQGCKYEEPANAEVA